MSSLSGNKSLGDNIRNQDIKKNGVFLAFLYHFFLQNNPKLILKPDFTDRNNTIGLLSIQNMAVDTKIRVLAWIQAKILKNTKIMAAILENGVCREG